MKPFQFKCTDKTHTSIGNCGHRMLACYIIEHLWTSLDGERYYAREDQLTEILAKIDKK